MRIITITHEQILDKIDKWMWEIGATYNSYSTETSMMKDCIVLDNVEIPLRRLVIDKVYDRSITIKQVIFNPPATIVIWNDNTKTVVKCQNNEPYDEEKGLALCIAKKHLGNKGNYNEVFKKWIGE